MKLTFQSLAAVSILAAASLGTALLTGCDGQASADASSSATASASASAKPAPEPDKPEEAGVTIIDKGKEPRALLRYAPGKGQKEKLKLTNRTTQMDVDGEEKGGPAGVIHLELSFTEKKDDALAYTLKVTEVDATGDKDMPIKLKIAVKQLLGHLEGLEGNLVTSDRGLTRDAKLTIPDDFPKDAVAAANNLQDTLSVLTVVLPTARVGEGAKWKHEGKVNSGGMKVDQVTEFELVERKGDQVKIKTTVTQTAKDQEYELAPGVKMKFLSHDAKGSADVSLNLAHLAPAKTKYELKSEDTIQQGSRPKKDVKSTVIIQVDGGID